MLKRMILVRSLLWSPHPHSSLPAVHSHIQVCAYTHSKVSVFVCVLAHAYARERRMNSAQKRVRVFLGVCVRTGIYSVSIYMFTADGCVFLSRLTLASRASFLPLPLRACTSFHLAVASSSLATAILAFCSEASSNLSPMVTGLRKVIGDGKNVRGSDTEKDGHSSVKCDAPAQTSPFSFDVHSSFHT